MEKIFINRCKEKNIFVKSKKEFLINLYDLLDNNIISTLEQSYLLLQSDIKLPDENHIGKFLSIAPRLSQGWIGYITEKELYNYKKIINITKELLDIDVDSFSYFDWSLELNTEDFIKITQAYYEKLDTLERDKFLKTYLNYLMQSIVDVFIISLNDEDFNSILNNLDKDLQNYLIEYNLI